MDRKCLVIGRGPSKDLVLDKHFDMDIICCKEPFHRNTMLCVTADMNSFDRKEVHALKNNLHLIIGLHPARYQLGNWFQSVRMYHKYMPDEERELEEKIIDQRNPALLDFDSHSREWKDLVKKSLISFEKYKCNLGTGGFALEWPINHGYNIIYTAGIDLYIPDQKPPGRWGVDAFHQKVEYTISTWTKERGVKIYKACKDSKLPVPVKFPE